MVAMRVVLLLPVLAASGNVPSSVYQSWFSSYQGLQMPTWQAQDLAQREWHRLNQCGVAIHDLQSLRDVMYNSGSLGLGLSISTVQQNILLLAEQHVNATALNEMYQILVGGWWTLPGGLTLPKTIGQNRSIEMIRKHAEPENLKDIYELLFGYSGGILLDQTRSQALAMEAAVAGADKATFLNTYHTQTSAGASQAVALRAAEESAIQANLHGLVRRYAKDGKLYAASGFKTYYQTQWLTEWSAAPQEKRVARDGFAYRAQEYADYFQGNWYSEWANDKVATQVRLANDGQMYTLEQFQQYYKDNWQSYWVAAPEMPCQECKPYNSASIFAGLAERIHSNVAKTETKQTEIVV